LSKTLICLYILRRDSCCQQQHQAKHNFSHNVYLVDILITYNVFAPAKLQLIISLSNT
jgi:hypothetical protein